MYRLPWLRVRNAPVVNGIVRFPLQGMNYKTLQTEMSTFSSKMFNKKLGGREIATQLRQDARQDSAGYAKRFRDAVDPFVREAINQHRIDFGFDTGKWGTDARRRVYSADGGLEGTGGHSVAVVTFEPLANAFKWLEDPRFPRFLTSAFPGNCFELTPEQYLKLVSGGREIDGTPTDVLSNMWPDIVSNNAKLLREGAEPKGPHMIGGNSFVMPESTVRLSSEVSLASTLMVTMMRHSQDGVVPWTAISHPEFPGGLVCVSMHFGQHPVPGGDMINAAIAAPLFKLIFRRGTRLADLYEDLVKKFGEEQASRLLLDPAVVNEFHKILWTEDWTLISDTAVLMAADATGGAFLNSIRMWQPDTVATLDSPRVEVSDRESFDALVDTGIKQSKDEGYTGSGGIEPADPGAIVPNYTTSISSIATPSDDTNAFARDMPLFDEMQSQAEQMQEASRRGFPWEFIRTEVEKAIRHQAQQTLKIVSDTDTSTVAELTKTCDTQQFRDQVKAVLSVQVIAAISGSDTYSATQASLGDGAAKSMVGLSVVDPVWTQMLDVRAGPGYLNAALQQAVIVELQHKLAEDADAIQERQAEASNLMDTTSGELAAKQQALKDVEAELNKDAGNTNLQQQQDSLNQEIARLAKERKQAEDDQRDARQAQDDNRRRTEDAAALASNNAVDERGNEIFHGE